MDLDFCFCSLFTIQKNFLQLFIIYLYSIQRLFLYIHNYMEYIIYTRNYILFLLKSVVFLYAHMRINTYMCVSLSIKIACRLTPSNNLILRGFSSLLTYFFVFIDTILLFLPTKNPMASWKREKHFKKSDIKQLCLIRTQF